jgi:hypothetical protein
LLAAAQAIGRRLLAAAGEADAIPAQRLEV